MKQSSEKKNICCFFLELNAQEFFKASCYFFSSKVLHGLDKQHTKGRSYRALEFGLSCMLLCVQPYCLNCMQKFTSRPINRSHLNSTALTVKEWAATCFKRKHSRSVHIDLKMESLLLLAFVVNSHRHLSCVLSGPLTHPVTQSLRTFGCTHA